MSKVVWVLDYDVPFKGNLAKHRAFYRAIHKLLAEHYGKDVGFSSLSCYFTDNEDLAKRMFQVAERYSKKCNLYKAVKM